MVSVFPILLSYNMAVPLAFRLICGSLFVYFACANLGGLKLSKLALFEKLGSFYGKISLYALVAIEMAGGLMLIVGIFTQAAALVLSTLPLIGLLVKHKHPESIPWSSGFLALLFLVILSLLFLGPGFYSLDLPF